MNLRTFILVSSTLLGLTAFTPVALADITLPRLISNGMVLQHGKDNTLWGWASNNENVAVTINGEVLAKTTTTNGTWELNLPPQQPGGPHILEIHGNNSIALNDIYFGDVWIAGGQSNMELPLKRVASMFPDEIAQAKNQQIRMFRVPKKYDFKRPKKDFSEGKWKAVTPLTAGDMSAVAWFFAKQIHATQNIPLGIIDNSYGGSAAESWMNEEALKAFPPHYERAKKLQDSSFLNSLINADRIASENWYRNANNNDLGLRSQPAWFDRNLRIESWPTISLPSFWVDEGVDANNGILWFRKEIILPQSFGSRVGMLELGAIVDSDAAWINGIKVGETSYQYPPRRYPFQAGVLRPGKNTITIRVANTSGKGGFIKNKPYILHVGETQIDLSGEWRYQIGARAEPLPPQQFENWKQPLGFYNAMLAPLLNTNIKGVIWYQGETNAGRPQEYKRLFPALIKHWREQFNQGDFPFLYVQLAGFLASSAEPQESDWAETRAAQTSALNEPYTGMAVAYDVGEWNDIHPLDKKTVGERLALSARRVAYAEDTLVHSGPVFHSLKLKGDKVDLFFDSIGGGLIAKGDTRKSGLFGFAVAGEDKQFHWAETKLKKKNVRIWSNKVSNPAYIRYAWADNPDKANLYNKEGLPAIPFEIDIAAELKKQEK